MGSIISQDDNRLTPGTRQKVYKADTLRKGSKGKRVQYADSIPKNQPEPIYSGFANVKNQATRQIRKKGGKLKRRKQR